MGNYLYKYSANHPPRFPAVLPNTLTRSGKTLGPGYECHLTFHVINENSWPYQWVIAWPLTSELSVPPPWHHDVNPDPSEFIYTHVLLMTWCLVWSSWVHISTLSMTDKLSLLLLSFCLPCEFCLVLVVGPCWAMSWNVLVDSFISSSSSPLSLSLHQVYMVRVWSPFPLVQSWKSLEKLSISPVKDLGILLETMPCTGYDNQKEKDWSG